MCSNKIKAAHDGGEQQQKAQQLDEPKKKGMALLCYDLKLKQLIPIKILFFVISAGKTILWFNCQHFYKKKRLIIVAHHFVTVQVSG